MPNVQEAPERLTGISDQQADLHIAVDQGPALPASKIPAIVAVHAILPHSAGFTLCDSGT
jgi:hypothetical protein